MTRYQIHGVRKVVIDKSENQYANLSQPYWKEDYNGIRQPLKNYDHLDSSCAFVLRNGTIQHTYDDQQLTLEGICGGYGTCKNGQLKVSNFRSERVYKKNFKFMYCPSNDYVQSKAWNGTACIYETEVERLLLTFFFIPDNIFIQGRA